MHKAPLLGSSSSNSNARCTVCSRSKNNDSWVSGSSVHLHFVIENCGKSILWDDINVDKVEVTPMSSCWSSSELVSSLMISEGKSQTIKLESIMVDPLSKPKVQDLPQKYVRPFPVVVCVSSDECCKTHSSFHRDLIRPHRGFKITRPKASPNFHRIHCQLSPWLEHTFPVVLRSLRISTVSSS